MLSTIPVDFDIAAYASLVTPCGVPTQVGMPAAERITMNTFAFNNSRAKVETSLVGGIALAQQLVELALGTRDEGEALRVGVPAALVAYAMESVARHAALIV